MPIPSIRPTATVTLLALGALTCPLAIADWAVARDTSTVTMYATKQGTWFDGQFSDFSAAIDFDPGSPERGSISGTVRTASIVTGDNQNDAFVLQYLDVVSFPEARFVSTSVTTTDEAYAASGELTLLGVTKPMTLYFTFEPASDAGANSASARLTGQMTIDRFEFGIANDIDTTQAGQQVTVHVELDLKR